jgi:transposase
MSKVRQKEGKMVKISQLTVINPHAGGIDVSDTEMMVAYPVNSNKLEIRLFGCFTRDLYLIADTLIQNGITSIAMESTGVYWIPLFLLLQEKGLEVCLVNAKHVKNVTGRKDDQSDAEWIQKLHSCGLLQASFQPDNMTRALRSLVRHRKNLIRTSAVYLNRMQKALELMNIKVQTIISDIDGKTGLSIIKAILEGERNPEILADLRDTRIKASREDIIKSLEGYWTDEHLFELKQCYEMYLTHRQMIRECEFEIQKQLDQQIASLNEGVIYDVPLIKRKRSPKHPLPFNFTAYANKLLGVNVTDITGINEASSLEIISETGIDMQKWKTRHHFTSWLGLSPNTKITSSRVISSKIMKKKHYAGQAFRMAALGLQNSKSPLGDFYRRIRAKAGPGKAVVATARKLAIIWYEILSKKEAFNPKAMEQYQQKYKEKKIKMLKIKLKHLEVV